MPVRVWLLGDVAEPAAGRIGDDATAGAAAAGEGSVQGLLLCDSRPPVVEAGLS